MDDKKNAKFIENAIKKHGNKYDYSKVEYVNALTKVCIVCPEHGEFWQTPLAHNSAGNECPQCADKKRGKRTMSTEKLVEKSNEVHGGKYSYDKAVYVNADTKIIVTCPEHGDFEQLPYVHLQGQGCPKCNHKHLSLDELIVEFRKVHGDYYDYSLAEKGKLKDKIKIICPKHGIFEQAPSKHLNGQGCPKCGIERRINSSKISKDDFVERCNKVHGNKYDYTETVIDGLRGKTTIICPKHGRFRQIPYDHLHGHGCPSCSVSLSKNEEELYNYICSLIGEENVERRNRDILNGREIDIYIPELKVGIEFNGIVWHSEKFGKDRYYHLQKTEDCILKGVSLYQVFEDEYEEHKEIIQEKIKHILDKTDGKLKVYARNTTIKKISRNIAKEFLNKYHIQGFGKSSVYLGCYYNDVLVGVMTFKNEGDDKWDLNRLATNYDYICIGVGGKLLKHFIRNYNPNEIKSFADRRWTTKAFDNIYITLGFKLVDTKKPDYKYTDGSGCFRKHKFNFRKKILSERYGFPQTMTENEMCKELGLYKVWDCGLYKYIWKKPVEK